MKSTTWKFPPSITWTFQEWPGPWQKPHSLLWADVLLYISCLFLFFQLRLGFLTWQLWVRIRGYQEKKESEVAQSCPNLCDPMDCSLPGSSVHGIFQARVLEWFATSFSSGSSRARDQTQVSHIVDRHFTVWATREVQGIPKLPWNVHKTVCGLGSLFCGNASCIFADHWKGFAFCPSTIQLTLIVYMCITTYRAQF